jgi:hypothetical protein
MLRIASVEMTAMNVEYRSEKHWIPAYDVQGFGQVGQAKEKFNFEDDPQAGLGANRY